MKLRLERVTDRADFEDVMACEWLSYESPMQPFFRIFCPLYEAGRQVSMQKAADLQWEWHGDDREAYWLKIIDEEAGNQIAGAAWWRIFRENPFQDHTDEVASWYPEGSTRNFASQVLQQMEEPRKKGASKPHVYLNIIFTHPEYRGRGVGSDLLKWGMDKADELDLEIWLDATPLGKPLYEKHGFQVIERNPLIPQTESPDDYWRKIEEEMGEMVFWTMVRPRKSEREGKEPS